MWNATLEKTAAKMRSFYSNKSPVAIKQAKRVIVKLPRLKKVRSKKWELVKCWCGNCRTCKERNWARLRRIRLLEEREAQHQFWREYDKEKLPFQNFQFELSDTVNKKTKGKLKAI